MNLQDCEIERLASEFIAEDWTPDHYYRELNLIAFARKLLECASERRVSELPRFDIRHKGSYSWMVPVEDGYWTPWHLAIGGNEDGL